jgi:hypothetical protein
MMSGPPWVHIALYGVVLVVIIAGLFAVFGSRWKPPK